MSSEIQELNSLLTQQNATIAKLEKELNQLSLNQQESKDPQIELIRKLTTENDKLKYRINVLKTSIEEAKSVKSKCLARRGAFLDGLGWIRASSCCLLKLIHQPSQLLLSSPAPVSRSTSATT